MTIVCYRAGVMASDSLVTSGTTRTGSMVKVSINKRGWMGGTSGNINECEAFHSWVASGCRKTFNCLADDEDDFSAMLISPSGLIYYVDGTGRKCRVNSEYAAVGSGEDYAMGAMAFGASAVEAVKVAIELCTTCGGDLQIVTST